MAYYLYNGVRLLDIETLSDGRTVEHAMTIGADGIPTKIGNMTLTISGVE